MRAHAAAHAVTHGFSAAAGALGTGSSERMGDQAASSPAPAAAAWRVKFARQAQVSAGAPSAAAASASPGSAGGALGRLAGTVQQSELAAEQSIFPDAQAEAHAQARVQAVFVPKARLEQPQSQLPVAEGRSKPRSHAPGLDVHGGPSGAPAHLQAMAASSARASGAGAAPGSSIAMQQEAGAAAAVGAGQPTSHMEQEGLHVEGGAPRRLPGSWPGAAGSAHEGRPGGVEPGRSAPGQAPGDWHGAAPGGRQGEAPGGRVDGAPGGWQGAALGGAADSGRHAQYDAAMAALFARLQPIGVGGERGALCCLAI